MPALIAALLVAQLVTGPVRPAPRGKAKVPPKPTPAAAPLCDGDYADALPAEKASAILDASKDPFAFAIRHVALVKLMADPQADIAVLKAKKQLPLMSWRIGRSASLRPGNLVYVRGFPLGAFAALNTGKVLNPMTVDSEKGWNHTDFVVDALLSSGNSGSPVFAVTCRT